MAAVPIVNLDDLIAQVIISRGLDGGNAANYHIVTGAKLSNNGDFDFIDTTLGGFAITLPSDPVIGNKIIFMDIGGVVSTNSVNILQNGNTIMGQDDYYVMNFDNSTVEFWYTGTDWRVR